MKATSKVPVEKGKRYEIKINTLGTSGEGVGKYEGFTVFVTAALPGETVRAQIDEVKKTYARATVTELLKKSRDRTEPLCPIYAACGGCQLQHMDYMAQLRAKRQQVIDALVHIGGLHDVFVEETIGAASPFAYRNKMQFPIGREKGKAVIGCFARGSHAIIGTDRCLIQKEGNNEILRAMRETIDALHLPVYDEDRHTGLLRHVVGREGESGELMVVLVTAKKELPHEKEIVKLLRKKLPRLTSLQQNVQTYRNNVILGRETRLLWGKPTIKDKIGRLAFHISPRSFFQVNSEQAAVLYGKAMEYANLSGTETVIDAYCGTGTITLYLAQKAAKAYGIEIVRPAIEDAKKNARDNGIKNAEFLVGDATEVMPRLAHSGITPDVITLDPPRAGCTETVLKTCAAMQPQRIVYISCNPATLARDLALLAPLGYQAKKVQPVDMFPETSHVETVTELVRATLGE